MRVVVFWVRLSLGILAFLVSVAYGALRVLTRWRPASIGVDTARLMARLVLPPLGVGVRVTGGEHLERAAPCVIVANHQSWLEYPVFATIFPPRTIVLGAAYIAKFPLVAWVYERTGNLYLERDKLRSAHGTMQQVVDALTVHRRNVWVFPEGTRGPGGGRMLPFKRGGFRAAIEAQVPVVPIVLSPLKQRHDLAARRLDRGTVDIVVLPPVPTEGLTLRDQDALIADVRARMQAVLDRANSELAPSGEFRRSA